MDNCRGQAGHYAPQRFFVAPQAIEGDTVRFTAVQWRQICRVLRLSPGDQVVVCDGSGSEFAVSLGQPSSSSGVIEGTSRGRAEPRCHVHLYSSALRGDGFDWLLQKATEVGVSAVTPVLFARTQPADYARRLARYRTIVREAAEQCARSSLPSVGEPLSLEAALSRIAAAGATPAVLLDEHEALRTLRALVESFVRAGSPPARVAILVGPEGGITRGERDAAHAAGLAPARVGSRILRSETAALVAATLVLAASGDLD